MKVLIVDDEPLARSWLARLLRDAGTTIVGEGQTAEEGHRLATDLQPHVVFLDVEMPGASGLGMIGSFAKLEPAPQVVLVTAHPEYAVEGFRQAVMDYLVKPVSAERLATTLRRAKALLDETKDRKERANPKGMSPNVIPVRGKGTIRLVPIHSILAVETANGRSILHTKTGSLETPQTLAKLEALLPSPSFVRVHASCIVQLAAIHEILLEGGHSYSLRLSNDLKLPISRQHYGRLCEHLRL